MPASFRDEDRPLLSNQRGRLRGEALSLQPQERRERSEHQMKRAQKKIEQDKKRNRLPSPGAPIPQRRVLVPRNRHLMD